MDPPRSAARSRPGNPYETGPTTPERLFLPVPARSIRSCGLLHLLQVVSKRLTVQAQARQHLLDRGHRGVELFRIARADDEIGVRLLVLVEERIAADDGVGMGVGDLPQGV